MFNNIIHWGENYVKKIELTQFSVRELLSKRVYYIIIRLFKSPLLVRETKLTSVRLVIRWV